MSASDVGTPTAGAMRTLHRVRLVHIVLDCSAAMAGPTFDAVRSGTAAFAAEAIRRGHAVGLIACGAAADRVRAFTTDIGGIRSALADLTIGGPSHLAGAIDLAASDLDVFTGDRAIVIVLGATTDDAAEAEAAAARASTAGIRVSAIGTGDTDDGFLDRLAEASGWPLRVGPKELSRFIAAAARFLPTTAVTL